MKRFAKTGVALLIALCVLFGQSGLVLAADLGPSSVKCTKCPCQSEKATCCVEQTNSTEPPESPAVPPTESRILQPVTLEPALVGALEIPSVVHDVSFPCRNVVLSCPSNVPLFLRHRAILI